ncbi:unnamed protein product [Spodoptera littoralis]|uniref:Uncharacterized protein n=1 Tax=Spodoptera littoralis TaxID=7109 RepID=A0A9P0IAG6_SPOLI|nr:unnamed protein product [Spodoptera littoralis]CAH1642315.1 unnamed protein product [Spodoptera littoralis]
MEAGFIPVSAGSGGNASQVNSVVAPPANVIRAPGLKRGKMEEAISDRFIKYTSHCNAFKNEN